MWWSMTDGDARDDRGFALVTVVGVIAVLTLLVIISYSLAQQALVSTRVNNAESQAFQIANAGIDTLYADLAANQGTASVLTRYETPQTVTVGGGTADIKLEQLAGIEYLATSTGHAADGTVETVTVRFYYLNLWEMFIAAGEDQDSIGGGAINGNATVDGPFYVRGDLGATGSTQFTRGPLFVSGDISMIGNFTIGTTDEPIDVYVGGTYPTSPPGNKNFHAKRVSNSVPDIVAPPLDEGFMDAAVARARQESHDNIQGTPEFTPLTTNIECTDGDASTYPTALDAMWTRPRAANASTWYKYIGPEAGRAAMGAGVTDLVIGGTGSWGSWENDGHGYGTGEWDDFAYDDVNNIMYIEGTVFVDGDITFNDDVKYRGNGALIANGDVTINGYLVPFGEVMSADEVLGVISAHNIYVAGDGNWGPWNTAAALYAKQSMNFTRQNVAIKGSIVAPQINFPQANFHLESDPNLPTFLPWSMPGRDSPILVIGAWARQ